MHNRRFARLKNNSTDVKKGAPLIFIPVVLSVLGIFFVYEASSVHALTEFGSSFYYFKLQIMWVIIGTLLMLALSVVNYKTLYFIAFPLMTVTIIMLLAVLIPGIGHSANGARRWIDLGVINFQPTEIAKLSIILYLASWFSGVERKRFTSFIMLIGSMMLLILLQPDMGTAIIVFCLSVCMYFLAGKELVYLFMMMPVAGVGFFILTHISSYRLQRYTAFLDPSKDPLGIGYHINQILISLGNGGLLGQGFGASKQKYLFLPEAHTDSIFAIIAEEFGFIGATLLIFLFFILLYKIYQVALRAPDRFGRLLAGGILAYFGFQIIINLAGIVSIAPLTGVPLPFISYGGSNILVSFSLIGILLNIRSKIKSL
jgi:cell division protein FtsW